MLSPWFNLLVKKLIAGVPQPLSLILVFLTVLLVLLPYTNAGFVDDDSYLSSQQTLISMEATTLPSYTIEVTSNWIMNGRLFPAAIFAGVAHWQIIQSLFAYHCFIIVITFITLIIFYRLLLLQTNQESVAQSAILLTVTCFQARDYYDPILSFHPLMDLVTICLLLSFIFFLFYLKSSSTIYLYRSLGCFLLTVLSYEISAPFAFIFPMLTWLVRPGDLRSFFKSLGFLVLSCLYVIVCLFIRNKTSYVYYGIGFGTIHDYFSAFIYQTTSVIPLISLLAPGSWKILIGTTPPPLSQVLLAILTGICGALALYRILRSRTYEKKVPLLFLNFVIPLSLLLLPPAILALSGKYQFELRWGLGYLPVYLQAFGFGHFLSLLLQNQRRLLQFILPPLLGIILIITSLNNSRMVDYRNLYWKDRRAIVENALQNNFFQDIPEKSDLYIIDKALWDIPAFYFQNGRIHLNCLSWKQREKDPLPPYYLLHYKIINDKTKEGELILEKFTEKGISEVKRFIYSPNNPLPN